MLGFVCVPIIGHVRLKVLEMGGNAIGDRGLAAVAGLLVAQAGRQYQLDAAAAGAAWPAGAPAAAAWTNGHLEEVAPRVLANWRVVWGGCWGGVMGGKCPTTGGAWSSQLGGEGRGRASLSRTLPLPAHTVARILGLRIYSNGSPS